MINWRMGGGRRDKGVKWWKNREREMRGSIRNGEEVGKRRPGVGWGRG